MYNYNMQGWQKMSTTTTIDGATMVLHEIRREQYHLGAFRPVYLPEKKMAEAESKRIMAMDFSEWGFDEVEGL